MPTADRLSKGPLTLAAQALGPPAGWPGKVRRLVELVGRYGRGDLVDERQRQAGALGERPQLLQQLVRQDRLREPGERELHPLRQHQARLAARVLVVAAQRQERRLTRASQPGPNNLAQPFK